MTGSLVFSPAMFKFPVSIIPWACVEYEVITNQRSAAYLITSHQKSVRRDSQPRKPLVVLLSG